MVRTHVVKKIDGIPYYSGRLHSLIPFLDYQTPLETAPHVTTVIQGQSTLFGLSNRRETLKKHILA